MPKATKDFAVERKKLSDLTPDKRNANRGTDRGAKAIAQSLKDYGAGRSILLDKHGNIIAGNKTAENAAKAGLGEDVLVVKTDGTKIVAVQRMDLDLAKDKRAKGLAIADNRAAELSLDWDPAVLASFESEIDLTPYFTPAELAGLLPAKELLTDEDEVPEPPKVPVTKRGDVWLLGRHRLMCGDSTVTSQIDRLLGLEREDAIVSDPPYGVGVNYASFEDSRENVAELIRAIMPRVLMAPCAVFTPGVPCMWLYPQPVWVMAWVHPAPNGGCPWGFAGVNPILAYGKDPYLSAGLGRRPDSLVSASDRQGVEGHPTPKPMNVWKWLVERVTTQVDQIVLDLFGGSGTTLIACESLGRRARLMELDPTYCDVIVERWQNATGKKAVLDGAA